MVALGCGGAVALCSASKHCVLLTTAFAAGCVSAFASMLAAGCSVCCHTKPYHASTPACIHSPACVCCATVCCAGQPRAHHRVLQLDARRCRRQLREHYHLQQAPAGTTVVLLFPFLLGACVRPCVCNLWSTDARVPVSVLAFVSAVLQATSFQQEFERLWSRFAP